MRSIRVGVIGCGYWGPNLVRNFARHPYSEVEAVCDMRYERAMRVGAEYRIPKVTDHPAELFANPDVDLIVVATPSFSHFPLAKAALEAGKHVLGMKPLATSTEHAEELCALAERQGVGGSKKMMIYDDMEASEKLKVYDKGFSIATDPTVEKQYQLMISYRSGDMHAPQLETREGLAVEVENVVRAVNGKEPLASDGIAGWRVVRILEAAQQSI